MIVTGHDSLPGEGERAFARSLSRHAVRWLRDAGLAADLVDDRRLADSLEGRRIAMLVCCNPVHAAPIQALRAFVAGGGRLVVCYSSSPELASLMDVSLGSYVRDPAGGRWTQMRFRADRPVNVPEVIRQSSPNLFPVVPRSRASRVLAWWEDREGQRSGEAAWVETPAGYWMTHVLLADGDARAKGQLLLALFAACDPSLWQVAASERLAAISAMPPFHGTAGAFRAADAIVDPERRREAQATARLAAELEASAKSLLEEGNAAEAWSVAEDWRNLLLRIHGCAQLPRGGEIRGVWDYSGQGLYPGDWPKTCRMLHRSGMTDLFVNVGGAGQSHCRANGIPPSPLLLSGVDTLADCLAAAHPLGIRVHAWVLAYSLESSSPAYLADLRGRGWILRDAAGKERLWIDPGNPEARAHLVAAYADIVRRYPVDGLHLDFVRYPDFPSALGAHSRSAFEAARGKAISVWPLSVEQGGAARREFMAWRTRQVTALVAGVRTQLRKESPGTWLTAAVFGKHPSCVEAVGQDWERWIELGLIDYAIPMNYTEDMGLLGTLLANQSRNSRLRNRTLSGVGVTAEESRLDASAVIGQVNLARGAGLPGFVLFDLDATLEQEILPVLRLGMTAPAPPRERRSGTVRR